MPERQPITPPVTSSGEPFDLRPISRALGAEPTIVRDGLRLELADQQLTAEFDPERGALRLTTRDAEISLHDLAPPEVFDDRIRLRSLHPETGMLQIEIDRQGSIALLITPQVAAAATESPQTAVSAPTRPDTHVDHQTLESEPETRPTEDDSQPATPPDTPRRPQRRSREPGERDERLQLTGRIVSQPRFRRSPRRQRFIAELDIEVELDDGSTVQEHVLAFDALAHRLQDQFEGGSLDTADVEVAGYRKYNRRQRRHEIYSVHIGIVD